MHSDNARQLRATAYLVLIAGLCVGISIASGKIDLADILLTAALAFMVGYLTGGKHA